MIVEDDFFLQDFYKQVIKFNGFELAAIASNGEEAISIFKSLQTKPNIILMDYRMPIKNGVEATKEILQIDPNAKIIFTTADKSVKSEALSIGSIAFKEKPFRIEKLVSNIKKIIG